MFHRSERIVAAVIAASVYFSSVSPELARGETATQTAPATPAGARDLFITTGKSVLVDSPVPIQRVAVANPETAEAIVTTPTELMVNGKKQGETSLIVWQQNGQRQLFNVTVQPSEAPLQAIQSEISQELKGQDVVVTMQDGVPFIHGTVKDLTSASRAVLIASVLGKPVNLLHVAVPATEPQILIKIRFANVDRASQRQLGVNIFSTGTGNTVGAISTQQFNPPAAPQVQNSTSGNSSSKSASLSIADALNLFLFRTDINLGATIRALVDRNLAQILAEPNVLAINGHTANFLAGGEFPFPTLQGGGAGLGAVTIQFREFGVRIAFTPIITPRGTIRMSVTPEVSSLDFANGLTFQGFTIPALSTRRVQTTVELQNGQSFAIGGLLDNRTIKNLNKIPGLGDIPLFGKLFQSEQVTKNNTELLVLVTPEIVQPVPAGQTIETPAMHDPFLQPNSANPSAVTQHPGTAMTGATLKTPSPDQTLPVEQLMQINEDLQNQSSRGSTSYQGAPLMEFVPVPVNQKPQPPAAPAPAAQAASPAPPASQAPEASPPQPQ
jgi:pilus assembly protein CpaC